MDGGFREGYMDLTEKERARQALSVAYEGCRRDNRSANAH